MKTGLYISTTTVYQEPAPTTLHTPAIVPAERLTSNNGGAVVIAPTPTNYCPTGYYSCAAQYYGGCCRVDRECNPTSCPAPPTTSTTEEPATIYVAPTLAVQGHCAEGWYGCSGDAGGGCCPNDYGCGGDSCTSTKGWKPTRTQVLPKATPDSGSSQETVGIPVLILLALGTLLVSI